jgi:TRAP-type uncharacterized transport system substrate-binding protein
MAQKEISSKSMYQRFKVLIWVGIAALIVWAIISEGPPTKITIEVGPKGGFFDSTAMMIKGRLKEHGVEASIINSEQTSKIISNVNNDQNKIDLGFIAHGVKSGEYPNVKSLGSIIMDPLFIFQRNGGSAKSPADFQGLKLGVGPPDTGGRIITDIVLNEYAISEDNATYEVLSLNNMVNALKTGQIDIGFFLQPTNNKIVEQLSNSGMFSLVSVEHASAIIKKNSFLHHLTINRGAFNLIPELPSSDIQMLGVPVTVIAKKNLHPAIVTVISLALKDEFRGPTLVSNRGAFPSMDYERDLNVDPAADKIYRSGTGYVPFLYRTFNFWIAGVLDELALVLSFLLTAYFFFYYMGGPKPFDVWKDGRAKRLIQTLDRLNEKAAENPLSKSDLRKIHRIEDFFTSSSKLSQKASHLIAEIKSRKN